MREWRNRQTHGTQNATEKSMWVQVPPFAPDPNSKYYCLLLLTEFAFRVVRLLSWHTQQFSYWITIYFE